MTKRENEPVSDSDGAFNSRVKPRWPDCAHTLQPAGVQCWYCVLCALPLPSNLAAVQEQEEEEAKDVVVAAWSSASNRFLVTTHEREKDINIPGIFRR